MTPLIVTRFYLFYIFSIVIKCEKIGKIVLCEPHVNNALEKKLYNK